MQTERERETEKERGLTENIAYSGGNNEPSCFVTADTVVKSKTVKI